MSTPEERLAALEVSHKQLQHDIKGIRGILTQAEHARATLTNNVVSLTEAMAANTLVTEETKKNTQDIVDLFFGIQKSTKFLIRLLGAVKWLGGIAGAFTAIYVLYTIYKTGEVPASLSHH